MRLFGIICGFLLLTSFTKTPPAIEEEVCLSQEERKLFDLIMDYRKSKKLKPIPYSAKLTKVAQTHVKDLMENYAYTSRNECNPHSWSNKGNWSSCCYTSDHAQASCMWDKPKEISGYEGNGFEIAYYSSGGANAVEGIEGWKKSPGHNPLLINSGTWSKLEWKGIGIGIYGQYGVVWFSDGEEESSKIVTCK
ncbi:MAG: CAP domain-containing protein [Cyclobacteriaceae bacterium]